ncbi:MAG: 6-phosphofructokinase [Chloroflexi bacterium]|nr:6-phosphofructokinase [Chloroflexota bacterium]
MNAENVRLGILVGGGPAPGINSAISACTQAALANGAEVFGIMDGFSHLMAGSTEHVKPLTAADVRFIHSEGGAILRTSRANPTRNPEHLQNCVDSLRRIGITRLASIGGEDTALSAAEVAKASGGAVRVAHIPKTIDNDLPLPGDIPTFGFETARHLGTELVQNLMRDSRTTNRWYVVIVMGRKAGHLALGIGSSAGTALSIIPEEFPDPVIKVDDVVKMTEGAMLKRKAVEGREDGIAVISEGVAERFDPEELAALAGIEVNRDPHGHIRLGELPLSAMLRRAIQQRFADAGKNLGMVDVTIGYELRCASPLSFDIDYTRSLGYGAARLLLSAPEDDRFANGGLIYLDGEKLSTLTFDELRDPDTGRTRVRMVDTDSERYKVAQQYMVRIQPEDLQDDALVSEMAAYGNRSPEEVRERFGDSDS